LPPHFEKSRLATLVDFLGRIGAANYPAIALVLDDEADQATLDVQRQKSKTISLVSRAPEEGFEACEGMTKTT